MCDSCRDWMYGQTLSYIARTGVHLEVALRLTRDCVIQNVVSDQETEKTSDEVAMQQIRDLTGLVDETAERMREMDPNVLAAVVSMVDAGEPST